MLAKVELYPAQAVLRTNRGEEFIYYSINREESINSFEDYFTLIRGPGGNEQYRFDQRMSIVREQLYRPDHQIFKGDDYSGFLVFAALEDEVASVELLIRGFALQFDEANHPVRTVDLAYHFDHRVEKEELTGRTGSQGPPARVDIAALGSALRGHTNGRLSLERGADRLL